MNVNKVDIVSLKEALTGKDKPTRTIIPIFKEHNNRIKNLVKIEYAPGTFQRYETTFVSVPKSHRFKIRV